MKYMMLIHFGDAPRPGRPGDSNEQAVAAFEKLSEDEQKAIYSAWGALNQTAGVTPGVQLQPAETATTVRVEGGQTVTTDGPFVETKEALGGYFLFEAENLEAAVELASQIPPARMGGAVEVRPVAEY